MGFEGFNPSTEEIKNISENKSSDSLNDLKNEINSQIDDKLLKTEASKELQEFIEKIKQNKEAILQDSKLVLNDLTQELQEDLNALNDLEDKFGNKPGFNTFKKFFISEISPADKEIVYDLVELGEFEKYIEEELDGEMFPDIEELQDFIDELIDKGKLEKEGKDSDIKEIFNLDIDKLSIQELNYYDKKINDLLQLALNRDKIKLNKIKLKIEDFIEEKKDLLLEKNKSKAKKERSEVKEERSEVKENEIRVKKYNEVLENKKEVLENKKEVFADFVLSLKGKGLKLTENIFTLANELKESIGESEKITGKLKKAILEELLKGDNLKIVIKQAIDNNSYDDVRGFLIALGDSQEDNNFLNKIKKVESELGILYSEFKNETSLEKLSLVRQKEVKEFLGNNGNIKQDGSVFKVGDKMVDLLEKPPKAYLVGEGGYKLETDMQKLKDTKEIIEDRRELQEIKLELKGLEKLVKNKIKRFKELKNKGKENFTKQEQIEFETLKLEIPQIKQKLKELIKKAEEIKENIENNQNLFDEREKEKLKEKQESQKETLKFIHSLGFDLIPQNISEDIIRTINLEKGVFGLQENIDLKNGNLGFHESGTDIDDPINKQRFAKLVNIMLSGNIDKPININSIGAMGSVTFIGEDEKSNNYTDASKDILDKLGAYPKGVILGNIDKFKKGTNK